MAGKMYKLAVTDSNSSQTISPTAHFVVLYNGGDNECYFGINEAATILKFYLAASEEVIVGVKNIKTVQAICNSGETTSLYINAASEL